MSYKPADHNSLSPYLMVEDVPAALDFIRWVFEVEPSLVIRRDDGSIAHAEVRIDDSVLMMGQMSGGPASHIHLYVDDVDSVFEAGERAGGVAVQTPGEKGDGDRRGGIVDPAGTTWWLATHLG